MSGLVRRLLGLTLGRRLPERRGRLSLAGLGAEAIIRRDRHGVPYIRAAGERDAWLALGFCHGQDRAMQLEITLRAVRGTLAALIGPDGLPVDRLSRRIGFRRVGELQLPFLRPAIRAQAAAYARGINEAYRTHPSPHELALLGARPTPWEAADVHGYVVLFCFALASNWDAELMRLEVLLRDGPEALAALDPAYPEHLPSTRQPLEPVGAVLDHLGDDLRAFGELVGFGGGSNAWALSPSKTATGRPLLANDPHLMSQAPPLMYLAQIRAPDLEVAGASWVGLPAFGPGHNGSCAWGVTAAHADNTDLFLEQIGPDGRSLREGDDFVPCELRHERITVKGAPDVVEEVLVGPRGPVIVHHDDPVVPDVSLPRANALSLSATWLSRRPYCGLYRAPDARTFDQFRDLFAEGSASTLTVVYADAAGHIGWSLAVELPERGRGRGTLPLPGWDPACQWRGLIPFDQLPRERDPESGFVCTANNQPVPHADITNGTPFLGADWLDGYRQQAIARALASRDDWDVASTLELQRDTTSLPWEQIRDAVLAISPNDDDAEIALTLLRHWSGQLASHSLAASVYTLFLTGLCDRVVRARAPKAASWALGQAFTGMLPHSTIATRRTGHLVRLIRDQPAGWFESWPATLHAALGDAVRELRRRHGDDPAAWAWGKVRPLTLRHPIHDVPVIGPAFDIGPFEGEGDNTTITQGGVDFTDPLRNQAWLPALRAVIDVGNWDDCRFTLLGGQSGNPVSPHYEDQCEAWRGDGVTVAWSESAIAARVIDELRLEPE